MKIEDVLNEICQILDDCEEHEWKKVFIGFCQKIKKEGYSNEINKSIREIYGGMGSFNDLILYNNDKLCCEENSRIDKLRKYLFYIVFQ